ncbi:MAG: YifB family Mg chelatase-like AAA ATPase [bacterium]|nr:YifB family Mg chelatase-like AAA ATPase [bacterium]
MSNLSKTFVAELYGIDAKLIEVEVDLHVGLHAFNIVGLADKALSEAKERVNSSLKNSGLKPPNRENRKITVNLAPADVKKTGSHYDLAIAVGYMLATKQIKEFTTKDKIFVGELALDGTLRAINGALSIALLAKKLGFNFIFLPEENKEEAGVVSGITVVPLKNLAELIDILEGRQPIPQYEYKKIKEEDNFGVTLSSVKGQENAKRALIIAASGGHNVLFIGSPGTGKSLLAEAMISILPDISLEESIEITKIWSAAGLSKSGLIHRRPFRSPHHSASAISIIGGGTNPKPGEISLAHRGVLFLDELPEFRRDILEALRQPLESGEIHIARAKNSLVFPSKFTLLAAMNPCPCGYFGDSEKECRCSANEVFRYQKKISGPLLDRIDIQITVPRVPLETLRVKNTESVAGKDLLIREQIRQARHIQAKRFQKEGLSIRSNSEMSSDLCDKLIHLNTPAEEFLKSAIENTFLSARSYYRILKTAQTIADLETIEEVGKNHLSEAFGYRMRQKE